MNYYKFLFLITIIFPLLLLSSCAVVGGIFKAGMGVGILMVVAVIVIILVVVSKMGKNK